MTDIDSKITEVLNADDQAFLASLDSGRGMFQQIGDSMHGPLAWWARLAFLLAIAIGVCLAYCFFRAVTADTTDDILGWGLASIALLIMQGFLKEWMFARMTMLTLLSEIKRLQVQVALISEAKKSD